MDVKEKIEKAVDYVLENQNTVIAANQILDIPLEDCLCSAIRKALQNHEQDSKK